MYVFEYMNYAEVLTDIHSILGVDSSVLPVETLKSLPILPAAEIRVIELLPNWENILDSSEANEAKLKLATLYYAAANAYPVIKLNVLQVENDNKTIAQRFKDALAWASPEAFEKKANQILTSLDPSLGGSVPLFSAARPAIDVVTGETNA